MSTLYRVDVYFSLTKGKPKLESIAIFTTTAACTTIPIFEKSVLHHYRIFPNKREMKYYIACLYLAHPDSRKIPLVIDSGQKELFKGVRK